MSNISIDKIWLPKIYYHIVCWYVFYDSSNYYINITPSVVNWQQEASLVTGYETMSLSDIFKRQIVRIPYNNQRILSLILIMKLKYKWKQAEDEEKCTRENKTYENQKSWIETKAQCLPVSEKWKHRENDNYYPKQNRPTVSVLQLMGRRWQTKLWVGSSEICKSSWCCFSIMSWENMLFLLYRFFFQITCMTL